MTHSWLLAVLGAIIVVNPPRHLAAFPGADRSSSDRLVISGVAGAFLVAVGVVVALLADLTLDAIDVSASTAQMGAGLVVVVTALLDLVRRLPEEIDGPAGPAAGVVPAGFPTLVRPEVMLTIAVVAASAGAWMAIVGLIAGAVAVVAWTLLARGALRGTAARAFGAFVSALAVAIGVELIVDGVYRL